MDVDDPVVRLCAQGMQAEVDGRDADARSLFRQAWDVATDDYGKCVAAHYLARRQNTPEQALHWNQECLDRADRVGDERVRGFYPSLHLTIARSHEQLGRPEAAREHYRLAAQRLADLPSGPYADGIRFAVAAGLGTRHESAALAELLRRLCARGDLTALGQLLPAYLGDLGTAEDRTRLLTALHMVHAGRSLPEAERALLATAIGDATPGETTAPAATVPDRTSSATPAG